MPCRKGLRFERWHTGGNRLYRHTFLALLMALQWFVPVANLTAIEPSVDRADGDTSAGALRQRCPWLPSGELIDTDPSVRIRLEATKSKSQAVTSAAAEAAGGDDQFFADGDKVSLDIVNESSLPVRILVIGLGADGTGTLLCPLDGEPNVIAGDRTQRIRLVTDGLDGYFVAFAWRDRSQSVGTDVWTDWIPSDRKLHEVLALAANHETVVRCVFLPGTSAWGDRLSPSNRPLDAQLALERVFLEAELQATCYALSGRLSAAAKVLQQAVEDCVAKAEKDAWQAATLRERLRDLEHRRRLTSDQRIRRAWADVAMAKFEEDQGYCPLGASRLFQLSYLAGMQTGDMTHAVTRGVERKLVLGTVNPQGCLSVLRDTAPPDSMSVARLRNNLGVVAFASADYETAGEHMRAAISIYERQVGPEHPNYATCLSNLGRLCLSCGQYPDADRQLRRALEIRRLALGEQHLDFARGLDQLAGYHLVIGDLLSAETQQRQASERIGRILGHSHPFYAHARNNLAATACLQGRSREAAEIWQQAVTSLRKNRVNDALFSLLLNNLGTVYRQQGELDEAERCFRESLDEIVDLYGEQHPYVALRWQNLAAVAQDRGRLEEAERCCLRALQMRQQILGPQHLDTADSHSSLAFLYQCMGDCAKAESRYREALAIARRNLELAAVVQSDRQQLKMLQSLRRYLDAYLSLSVTAGQYSDIAYHNVLRWKGAVLMRQRESRAVSDQPELADTYRELQSAARRLATLALATPDPKQQAAWHRQISELTERKERLEAELAQLSGAFRAARQEITLQDLTASLPSDFALVDYLEYSHYTPAPKDKPGQGTSEQRLVAFVVRPGKELAMVSLGPARSVAEAVDQWRQSYGRSHESRQAGQRLRQQVWEPLQSHLAGARMVLVSPDGVLGRFPLAALPGKEPGKYLLQEQALAVLPVAQALPALMRESGGKKPDRNLLLIGGVDYEAQPGQTDEARPKKSFGRRAERGSEWRSFTPLDGTLGELATIEKMYQDTFGAEGLTTLRKGEPSEARFWQEASRHLYLHLATHGFFAPPELRSAWQSTEERERTAFSSSEPLGAGRLYAPGLLSGVALAGANRPPSADSDDGILTAEEVQNLDLRGVELAMLSACETGLGEVAGGEGLLGLQRAFQVAGARTVVASLWKVHDEQTRALMERFYRNLWEKDMTKLEALREAQLWMLSEGPRRGLVREDADAANVPTESPPYYWAAFVLSGDWR